MTLTAQGQLSAEMTGNWRIAYAVGVFLLSILVASPVVWAPAASVEDF